ncbi:MAG: acyl-CoA dehydrogenase family protein [Planctomycetota bacterium]
MHNLQLGEDQEMIVDTVRKFVADAVAPKVLELDEHRTFARAQFDGLAELGVFGMSIPETFGGAGMGWLPYVAALESVGAQSSSLARLWIGQAQCAAALAGVAEDPIAEVVAGSKLATFVGPEHGVTFSADKVTGTARVVPAGGEADFFVVAASDAGTPVLAVVQSADVRRRPLTALGLASASCAAVQFEASPVYVAARGGSVADAIAKAQIVGWIGVAATMVGGGLASFAAAKKHASERIAFGKPLLVQEAVQRKLVESKCLVDAARHLVWHAARVTDLGQDATEVAISARLAAVEACVNAADEAIQIHGGYGYTVEYHVERHYRDGKMLEVLDGGGEALRNRLAASQLG